MLKLFKFIKDNGLYMRVLSDGLTFDGYDAVLVVFCKDNYHVAEQINLSAMEHCSRALEELLIEQAKAALRGPLVDVEEE